MQRRLHFRLNRRAINADARKPRDNRLGGIGCPLGNLAKRRPARFGHAGERRLDQRAIFGIGGLHLRRCRTLGALARFGEPGLGLGPSRPPWALKGPKPLVYPFA